MTTRIIVQYDLEENVSDPDEIASFCEFVRNHIGTVNGWSPYSAKELSGFSTDDRRDIECDSIGSIMMSYGGDPDVFHFTAFVDEQKKQGGYISVRVKLREPLWKDTSKMIDDIGMELIKQYDPGSIG